MTSLCNNSSIGPVLSSGRLTGVVQSILWLDKQEPYAYQQLPRRQQRPQTRRASWFHECNPLQRDPRDGSARLVACLGSESPGDRAIFFGAPNPRSRLPKLRLSPTTGSRGLSLRTHPTRRQGTRVKVTVLSICVQAWLLSRRHRRKARKYKEV